MTKPTRRRAPTVRVGPMINLAPLLDSLGHDSKTILGKVQVPPEVLLNPNNRLDYHQADAMLAHCAQETGQTHLGLLLGKMAEPWHLGLPGLVVYFAPTVRQALESLVEMLDLHDEAIDASLDVGPEYSRLSFLVFEPGVLSIEVINDLTATMLCKIMRLLCGPRWTPTAISIPSHEPANLTAFNRYFRSPVYFNASELAMTFENRWLTRSPATSDPLRYRRIKVRAAELHDLAHLELIDRLPVAIRRGLLLGRFSAHQIAGQLGIHERTLHRRLTAVDTSFRTELDRVRQSFAEQLLEATSMPVSDVASALGYTHTSSFIRAFERWCEVSPAQWRARQDEVRVVSAG